MTEKIAENINQCINDFSHRIMREMQFLMGERYPLGIDCLGIVSLSCLFENQCLITIEGRKRPWPIV